MRATLLVAALLLAGPGDDRALPRHPGGIAWERDLAAAQEASAKDGRPVAAYLTFDT